MSDLPLSGETRLRERGSAAERSLLASADTDRPDADLRRALTMRVLGEHRARRRRLLSQLVGAGVLGLSVAASVAIANHGGSRSVSVAAEPHASIPRPNVPVLAPSASVESAFAPCTPPAVASGEYPLIDDFEDGDARAPMLEHRAGTWFTFNDGSGVQAPKPGALLTAMRIPGGRGASHFGLHSTGGKFNKWGANLSLELNPRRCYDASAYAGVQFWARGHGELRVVVQMTHVVSEEFGGSCTHDCFDGHATRIQLGRDFKRIEVRWAELRQTGFGTPLPFDARSLFSIAFSVLPEQTPFDFWIDDVSFIPR